MNCEWWTKENMVEIQKYFKQNLFSQKKKNYSCYDIKTFFSNILKYCTLLKPQYYFPVCTAHSLCFILYFCEEKKTYNNNKSETLNKMKSGKKGFRLSSGYKSDAVVNSMYK